MRTLRAVAVLAAWSALTGHAAASPAPTARAAYERAVARERTLDQATAPSPRLVRRLVAEYETLARRYENTGYADNALWRGAGLSASLYDRTRVDSDRRTAVRLLQQLVATYPTSSLVAEARPRIRELSRRKTAPPAPDRQLAAKAAPAKPPAKGSRREAGAPPKPPATSARADATDVLAPDPALAARDLPSAVVPAAKVRSRPIDAPLARVVDIRRNALPEVVRVTIELDAEIPYQEERAERPSRVFFDLESAAPSPHLQDGLLSFSDDIVRQVRYGARGPNTTRVVMDLEGVQRYSVFSLYNPFRIVIDFERVAARAPASVPKSVSAPPAPLPSTPIRIAASAPPAMAPTPLDAAVRVTTAAPTSTRGTKPARSRAERPAGTSGTTAGAGPDDPRRSPAQDDGTLAASNLPVATPGALAPATPAANASGTFSLARQLGLGVSRIVIDPGHGGHDPGAQGSQRLWEAELVLDVALRLEKLLLQQPGIEVVLTRRTDTFVALEERTAMANRERADLFLSIHANASRNRKARGVESYFLNFASNPQAEEVAARENSASGRTMRNLPDMLRAIALNNKLDESRDFASMVQHALIKQLEPLDPDTKDLGVKQAPFVVLIGAQMPSVLAEISFITNPQEGALLRTSAYRQGIAQALFEAVVKYQRSLKSVGTVAGQ